MEFYNIIDTLVKNISDLNDSLENTESLIDAEPPIDTKPPIDTNPPIDTEISVIKNTLSRDQYTMESIQRKQNYINYKRDIKKDLDDNNKLDYTVVSNDDLMNVINLLDYNKTWTRLDKYQKKKKLIEYINYLIDSNSLDSIHNTDLLKELQSLIFSKKIKSSAIQYDIKSQRILSIKGLELKNKSYCIK